MNNPQIIDVNFIEMGVPTNRTLAQICYVKLTDTAIPFKYSRDGDACLDIYSDIHTILRPYETMIVPSNIAVQMPKGFYGIVAGRSGLASKGIHAHVGTIDNNYRGSVGVILYNSTNEDFYIKQGDRIGQFSIAMSYLMEMVPVSSLDSTERGAEGFGSSGTR